VVSYVAKRKVHAGDEFQNREVRSAWWSSVKGEIKRPHTDVVATLSDEGRCTLCPKGLIQDKEMTLAFNLW